MKKMNPLMIVVLAVAVLVGSASLFTVPETQRALVVRLGKLDRDSSGEVHVRDPGLHLKVPFVTVVRYFDSRLQTLELKDARIVTKEKKDVIVSSFTKWRIDDFSKFYKATNGNMQRAGELLGPKVSDALRAEFGKRTIKEVVSGERMNIMELLQEAIDKNAESIGVSVIDMRIKRIDLPTEVSESVFDRMRAEREQAATQHRADGKREAEKIRATADKEVIEILARADRTAKKLRGEGDAEAASIYAKAYTQDAEFFTFYKSLNTYVESFRNKDDLLVLSPDNDFFRYFKQSNTKHSKSHAKQGG